MVKSNTKEIYIIGAGGHSVSVANVAIAAGYKILAFIDETKAYKKIFNINILKNISEINCVGLLNFAIAIGKNETRNSIFENLKSEKIKINYPSLIHPSAIISEFTEIGKGTIIMPNAVVGPNCKIGDFCIINTKSSIDHDGTLSDFASLAPGVTIAGSVFIGKRSQISIGATIKENVVVGADSILGANSYLNKNLSNSVVAYGTPAKIIRSN